jgi:hypothetical protein
VAVVGLTVQVAVVLLAQLPPVQIYDVAAGLQLAERVEEAPAATAGGLAPRVHTGADWPFCVTVKVCPAMVSVPFRGVVPVYAGTEYTTRPLAVVDSMESMVIQSALGVAVQPPPHVEVTGTLLLGPPAVPNVAEL